LQSERDYLRIASDYRIAEMLNRETAPAAKILALATTWNAYIDREMIQYWQSSLGSRMRETILEAAYTPTAPLYDWTATFPAQALRAIRFRALAANQYEWEIHEAAILLEGDHVRPSESWRTTAWPGLFEAPFALDGNLATRWRTWDPERPGMFFEIDFGQPQPMSGAAIASHWETPQIEVLGMAVDGKWSPLSSLQKSGALPTENLRRAAMRYVKAAGIDYILTPVEGSDGGVWLGKDLENHSAEYGMVEVAKQDTMRLYKLDY